VGTFLKAFRDLLTAIDFTTVEVWSKGGLVTFYLLFVMELKTRRVHLNACTTMLGNTFMKQIAETLTNSFDGLLADKKYVPLNRDSNFIGVFRAVLNDSGVRPVRLRPRRLNSTPSWNFSIGASNPSASGG